jgi:hypothetical protein
MATGLSSSRWFHLAVAGDKCGDALNMIVWPAGIFHVRLATATGRIAAGVGAGMPMQLLVATLLCHAEDRFESR